MTNLLEQAISCDDGDQAAKILQQALGGRPDGPKLRIRQSEHATMVLPW